ncbi:MAG: hemolysin III family protein, partial [Acidimicrobiales bacterium]
AGTVALVAASPILFTRARTDAQVGWILSYLLGVGSMMATSTLYHRGSWSPEALRAWRRADFTAIFLAIAGSGVAVAGLTLHGAARVALMAAVALGGLAALVVRRFTRHLPGWSTALSYLVAGWAAAFFTPQIARGGGVACALLVIAGGLAYSAGAVVYASRRPRLSPRVFGFHELFHVCTLLGAGLHFAALAVALR